MRCLWPLAAMTLLTLTATDLHVAGGNAAARAYARLLRDGFPKPPAPVTADAKRAVLATLPAEGEAELDATTKAKLEVLQPVLTEYGRTAVTEIKVVQLPYACMALYGRVVLIISGHTLRALTAEELQAVAAHELAHEYYWAEYYTAREAKDIEARRETELLADAIAIRALLRLGKNPKSLISAISRM